ncbi:glycosyltransferase family 4 protein [soil metagenome]
MMATMSGRNRSSAASRAGAAEDRRRIVAVNASGECSGAERVLLALVRMGVNRGYDVVVASPAGPLTDELPGGCRHVELPPFAPARAPDGRRRLRSLVAWTRTWRPAAKVLAPEVRRPGTTTVVNSLLALPMVRLARPRRPVTWLVHDVVRSRAQRVVIAVGARPVPGLRSPVGRAVAVSAAAAAPLGDAPFDVVVAPHGVRWPVPSASSSLHDPPLVGTLGLVTAWKGLLPLLDAIAMVPEVRLEVAGSHFVADAGFLTTLEARSAQPDLAGRVRFLGPVDPLPTISSWDVFVSASISPEAGPLTVLEAMSVGVPVVATAHGGPVEYLAGGAGLLVPPGDVAALAEAIRAMVTDGDLREGAVARARQRIAADHVVHNTHRVLFDAVMRGGGRP